MLLTDDTYFVGEIFLPNMPANLNYLNLFIAKREPEFLNKVLGIKFYKLFLDGLGIVIPDPQTDPPTVIEPRWLALRDGAQFTYKGRDGLWLGFNNASKQSPLANYIYYWYTRSNVTQTTSGGETLATIENSKPISSLTKQARAWNEMCDYQVSLITYLLANQELYPEFVFDERWLWELNYNNWYDYFLTYSFYPAYLFRHCNRRLYERQSISGI